jgi:hypothetical protein
MLCLSPPDVADVNARFLALLDEGDPVHPRTPTPKGTRGTVTRHPARHLPDRLLTHQRAVLLFLERLDAPFENTLAERDIRMVNAQHTVSGSLRRPEGAVPFCRIHGSVSTLRTQSVHVFSAWEATVRGHPLLPSFSET